MPEKQSGTGCSYCVHAGRLFIASSDAAAGWVFTGSGSVIYAENGQFFSVGQHPSNTCYDGMLIYNNSTLTGGGLPLTVV